jgi:5-methylcytosine-specific restriction enzyme A
MNFQEFHNDFFNSRHGAYSRVTDREFEDSQITLTDVETDIVINHFGKANINVGGVGRNRELSSKTFLLYPSLEPTSLNLVFPKPHKAELRLYLSTRAGFKPSKNNIWFLYLTGSNDIVIGSMRESEWRELGQVDDEDELYQSMISTTLSETSSIDIDPNGRIIEREINQCISYVRDPRLAAMRFNLSGFTCEVDSSHTTFVAQRTKRQFVEAHHFIPMKYQHLFPWALDNLNNIISLCPNCHRAIHHAVPDDKYQLIDGIYQKRPALHNLTFEDIAQYYNVLKIVHRQT